MRAKIKDVIEQVWESEKATREYSKPDLFNYPIEVCRYFKAWKRAYKNRYSRRADHYIAQAYEEWEMAVGDSCEAARILGEVHDGVQDFESLPMPNGGYLRTTKREIVEQVLARFKADPENFLYED